MSQTMDYFFDFAGSLAALADGIAAELGIGLTQGQEATVLVGHMLGMDLILSGNHGYEDDHGIRFANYSYCAGIRTFLPDAALRPLQVATMASLPYLLFRRLGASGILVFDLQRLIASYQPRAKADGTIGLFELGSGSFADEPEYWRWIARKVPRRAYTAQAELGTIDHLRASGRNPSPASVARMK